MEERKIIQTGGRLCGNMNLINQYTHTNALLARIEQPCRTGRRECTRDEALEHPCDFCKKVDHLRRPRYYVDSMGNIFCR